ncbi:MAG: GntR family transcriptional regulator [Treponema sp.]|jgi:DNA-binding transcriptional regulator YhcF (GntR family)|nr:GntR family transcriptional regulator [Treponema sp.]
MNFQFNTNSPIYLQIVESFKNSILSGELAPNSKVLSVRDLALQAGVNPNTMQKALTELERLNLVRTERTSGRFITGESEQIENMRKEAAENEIQLFIERMKKLGFEKKSLLTIIEKKLKQEIQK